LANLWGDGVIISTPLGSMGRNINLSGPILYKSLESITIVPISPLSLKFRPIILPATA
jgi:NAD+ kinase